MGGAPVEEAPVYPGALKRNIHVMAKLRNKDKYLLAKVIEVRIQRSRELDAYGLPEHEVTTAPTVANQTELNEEETKVRSDDAAM
jgi:hypothetical protein